MRTITSAIRSPNISITVLVSAPRIRIQTRLTTLLIGSSKRDALARSRRQRRRAPSTGVSADGSIGRSTSWIILTSEELPTARGAAQLVIGLHTSICYTPLATMQTRWERGRLSLAEEHKELTGAAYGVQDEINAVLCYPHSGYWGALNARSRSKLAVSGTF